MMIAGEKSGIRWLRNGVFGSPDIFKVQTPIELEVLVVWDLVAKEVVIRRR